MAGAIISMTRLRERADAAKLHRFTPVVFIYLSKARTTRPIHCSSEFNPISSPGWIHMYFLWLEVTLENYFYRNIHT